VKFNVIGLLPAGWIAFLQRTASALSTDQRYILFGGAATLLVRVIGTALITGLTILVARSLGASDYGHFAFFLSLVFVAALLGTLGLPAAANLFVVRYRDRAWEPYVRHYIGFGFTVSAVFTVAVTLAGIAALRLYPPTADLLPLPVAGMVLFAAAVAWLRLGVDVARALGHPVAAAVAEQQLYGRGAMLAVVASIVAAGADLSAAAALYIWTLSAGISGLVLLWKIRTAANLGAAATIGRRWQRYRLWLSVSTTMLVTPVFFFIVSETDVLALGFFREPAEVGIYNVARRLAEITQFPHAAMVALVLPRLAKAYGQRDTARFQACVDTMNLAALIPGCIAIVLLVTFRYPLLSLFGAEFTAGQQVILIMCITRVVDMTLGPASEILMMSGRHVQASRINIAFSVFNIVLNLLLVPRYGMVGAAVTTLTTVTLWKLTLLVPCIRAGIQPIAVLRALAWAKRKLAAR
jgi:O-antigen/teichoic acid export membrane protein